MCNNTRTPRRVTAIVAALISGALSGCADDDAAASKLGIVPEDAGPRALPVFGARAWDGGNLPLGESDIEPARPADDAGVPCCDVTFALAALAADEAGGYLRGDAAPLSEVKTPLTLRDGDWQATVCVPPTYSGSYYFEIYLVDDLGEAEPDPDAGTDDIADDPAPFTLTEPALPHADGGLFRVIRANPQVTRTEDPRLGFVNRFEAAESCADLDVDRYAETGR